MAKDKEEQPVAESSEEASYDEETVEQLEARFAKGEGLVNNDPEEPEAPPAETPEPPAGKEAEPPKEPAAEPEAEVVPDEPAEDVPDEQALLVEELRLQVERADRDRKKQEFLAGRATGESGFLKRRIEQLEQSLAGREPTPDSDYDEPDTEPTRRVQPTRQDSVHESRLADLEQERREAALEVEYSMFLSEVKNDVVSDLTIQANGTNRPPSEVDAAAEVDKRMQALIPQIHDEIKPYGSMQLNAKSSRKVARLAFDSAYTDWKLQRLRDMKLEASKKRVSQVPARKREKLAATISGSGGASVPADRPKTYDDMSVEELEAELKREEPRRSRIRYPGG